MKFQTGAVFGNRYTLGERIAVGGMGEVWEATDQVLGRIVAIKLLSPALADQAGFAQRFREEARNTAALSHPNIAAVYDYGEDEGASWLVMELVRGEPLSAIIAEHGTLSAERTISITAQAAHALQAAHERGVIHRDVKPANIMVKPSGEVKLTDFGISRATDAVPITRTGEVMGTAQYISPEQATGQPVSPASDIYALGCVAYEMLTGRRPFDEGSPVATAMAHVTTPAPPLPDTVPPSLAAVIMSCLAKAPSDRPRSARALADNLRGAPTSGFPVTAPIATTERLSPHTQVAPVGASASPPPRREVAREPESNHSALAWLLPLLLVLLVGGFLLVNSLRGSDNTPAPSPTPSHSVSTQSESPSEPVEQTESESPVEQSIQVSAGDYIGLTYDDAAARLRRLGLEVRRVDRADDAPQGQVLALTPSGSVTPGSTITLTVSTGPEEEPAPEQPQEPAQPAPQSEEPSTPAPEQPPAEEPDAPKAPATAAEGIRGPVRTDPPQAPAGAGVAPQRPDRVSDHPDNQAPAATPAGDAPPEE